MSRDAAYWEERFNEADARAERLQDELDTAKAKIAELEKDLDEAEILIQQAKDILEAFSNEQKGT